MRSLRYRGEQQTTIYIDMLEASTDFPQKVLSAKIQKLTGFLTGGLSNIHDLIQVVKASVHPYDSYELWWSNGLRIMQLANCMSLVRLGVYFKWYC